MRGKKQNGKDLIIRDSEMEDEKGKNFKSAAKIWDTLKGTMSKFGYQNVTKQAEMLSFMKKVCFHQIFFCIPQIPGSTEFGLQ